ncbi:hypothetical protein V6C53_08485 [Desulfocurvibacter africanus]|uniref:Uncharacterized protein n=1 Tax=Desulfocurvibacter africanus subsp. africanus str. Walvis Bay TaxID=690850 RepID=F3Z357_DESAF|nr:hypothetical protein [Desulfocurvibacter africanus]EGJ50301.1 hypothetical protein Desaf_1972 [Desulfocurvibacter africanus subsp. africanus str. Walvis Bay]
MQDDKGLFYYPFPQNKHVRMYVKEEEGTLWFRMWNANDAKLWEDHGWVPYGAVKRAKELFKKKGPSQGGPQAFDPDKAYDPEVARLIIKEGK